MKLIITMLTLAFATQIYADSSCGTNQDSDNTTQILGQNGHGTWQHNPSNP